MMVVWPKHVVAATLEEEKKNSWVDGPIVALLNIKQITNKQYCCKLNLDVIYCINNVHLQIVTDYSYVGMR
jgi:hypothetical protein